MKREFINFFRKKYVLIILPILLFISLITWYTSVQPDIYKHLNPSYTFHSNFIIEIEMYDSQEELEELLENKNNGALPGMVSGSNVAQYRRLLYKFSLDNQLPYDSLVEYSEMPKYTQFHYLGSFKTPILIFIILACLIVGGFYQTSDISNKMSKLIYTSGEKRSKIVDRKYGASLLIMIAIVTVFESIVALFGLMYCDSGAKYCVLYLGGDTLHYLNYFQYFCTLLFSHLLALVVTYTFVYYLSVICKNGIIPVCSIFSIMLVAAFAQRELPESLFYDMLTRGGIIEALYETDIKNAVNLKNLCLYIPIAFVAIIPSIISRFTIKRADYSR